jgi:hypothetical protein
MKRDHWQGASRLRRRGGLDIAAEQLARDVPGAVTALSGSAAPGILLASAPRTCLSGPARHRVGTCWRQALRHTLMTRPEDARPLGAIIPPARRLP